MWIERMMILNRNINIVKKNDHYNANMTPKRQVKLYFDQKILLSCFIRNHWVPYHQVWRKNAKKIFVGFFIVCFFVFGPKRPLKCKHHTGSFRISNA